MAETPYFAGRVSCGSIIYRADKPDRRPFSQAAEWAMPTRFLPAKLGKYRVRRNWANYLTFRRPAASLGLAFAMLLHQSL